MDGIKQVGIASLGVLWRREMDGQMGIAPLAAAKTSRELSQKPNSALPSSELKLKQKHASCLDLATKLLGSRRHGSAADPEIYIAAVTRVLSGYPVDVAQRVIDPLSGPLAAIKWLPEPSEVRQACESLYSTQRYAQEWNARTDAQLAEREAAERNEADRPTAEEIRAKHGEHCGFDPRPDPALAPPDPAKRVDTAQQRTVRMIQREYAAAGYAPVVSGGLILSPSLLKNIGKWPPVAA